MTSGYRTAVMTFGPAPHLVPDRVLSARPARQGHGTTGIQHVRPVEPMPLCQALGQLAVFSDVPLDDGAWHCQLPITPLLTGTRPWLMVIREDQKNPPCFWISHRKAEQPIGP